MSFNLGCGCNCGGNNNGQDNLAYLQRGDTFPMELKYKDGDTVIPVEEGYDILVALYDYKGELLTKGTISDGRLVAKGEGYEMFFSHEESLLMIGKVRVEVTLFAKNKSIVDHADHAFTLIFEDRENNQLI